VQARIYLIAIVAVAGCESKPEATPAATTAPAPPPAVAATPPKELPVKPANELPADVATAIAPGARHAIYPILKAYDWPAKALSAFEPFAGSDKPPVPLVAYGYDTGDHYVFVTKADLEKRPLADIKKEAFANLEKYPAEWEAINEDVLTASGTDFSAEMILSKKFLIAAQNKLGAKQILVGVPRRRVIYAADEGAPKSAMDQFYLVFRKTYEDDSYGNAPITNLLFRFRDGELVGAQSVDAK
jgi:uncharacterized protein YtpQ (UPF0354 family)